MIKFNGNSLRWNLIFIRKQLSAPKAFVKGDFKYFGFPKEYCQHHKAPVLVIVQQKEMLTEIQVQYCFCCCSSCLWQMAILDIHVMILRFGRGFLCTFCQSCRNKFCLCFYWNSFSGDNVGSSQTTSSSNRLGRTRALWSCSEATVGNIWNWRHHLKLRDDEKGLTEALSALPIVWWLKLRLDFEGRLHQALPTHHWQCMNLSSNTSPAQFTTRQPVPLLHPWSRFGGRNAVEVVCRLAFIMHQCAAASSKLVW